MDNYDRNEHDELISKAKALTGKLIKVFEIRLHLRIRLNIE